MTTSEEIVEEVGSTIAASFFDKDRYWLVWLEGKVTNPYTKLPWVQERRTKDGRRFFNEADLLLLTDVLLYSKVISRIEHEAIVRRIRGYFGTERKKR